MFHFSPENGKAIAEHEDEMLAAFAKVMERYAIAFVKYGCVLNLQRI